jgi:ribosomal protein S7
MLNFKTKIVFPTIISEKFKKEIKMSRRRRAKKRIVSPDPTYDSRFIHMLVNRVMSHGKSLAYKIVYQTMESIAEKPNKIQLKF